MRDKPFPILRWSDEPTPPPGLTAKEAQLADALSAIAHELSGIRAKQDALITPAHSEALLLLRSIGRRNWTTHLR